MYSLIVTVAVPALYEQADFCSHGTNREPNLGGFMGTG